MSAPYLRNKRLAELLAQRAIDGLTGSETTELERLLAKYQRADEYVIDNTASALLLASTLRPEPLPDSLLLRLEKHAECFTNEAIVEPTPAARRARSRQLMTTNTAWFAVAASVLVAVAGWWPRLQSSTGSEVSSEVSSEPPIAQTANEIPEPTVQEQRTALLSHAAAIQRTWQPTDAAMPIGGDIVWDNVASPATCASRDCQPMIRSRSSTSFGSSTRRGVISTLLMVECSTSPRTARSSFP